MVFWHFAGRGSDRKALGLGLQSSNPKPRCDRRQVLQHSLVLGCHAHGFAWACPLYAKRIRMATQSRGHGTQP
jgi:hypothetical protein